MTQKIEGFTPGEALAIARIWAQNTPDLSRKAPSPTPTAIGLSVAYITLYAENERLREALRLVVDVLDDPAAFALDGQTLAALTVARAALSEGEDAS